MPDRAAGPPGPCLAVRSVMTNHDRADDFLIDISGLSLPQLSAEVDESSLGLALRRILTPQEEIAHHGFSNII